jgi:hypothetical protein
VLAAATALQNGFITRDYITIDVAATRVLVDTRIDAQLDLLLRIFVVVRPLHISRNITWLKDEEGCQGNEEACASS